MRKKLTAVLLAATMLLTSGVTVFADRVDAVIDKPYLALGADLSPQEQMKVLSLLGLSDINVDDYDIISITNADEHEYLDKYLDASIIGTRALSSVLVVGKEAGNGIHVTTKNISYCTEGMYRNALLTAGIEDADITVAGPFSISGTAALVGAIKAYETMTGEEIDDENLDAANDELVLTGKLVEDIGDSEKAEDLMALVKQEVAENKLTSAEDIQNVVDQRIGRRAVLFVVFQVGVNGHSLGFPGFLCRRGAHKAADGTQLGVSNAHQAVHQVEFHIPAQALALDVQVRHGDGIFRAEQPAQAVFLLRREQGGIRPADGGGHRVDGLRDRLALRGALFLCKRRGDGPDQQHRRQQKRRRPAREHRNVFQDGFLLFSTISFSLV